MTKIKEAARLVSLAGLVAALHGCGGNSDAGPTTVDTTATAAVSAFTRDDAAVLHNYTKAGTYELTVTGTYTTAAFAGADHLSVWVAFSGQGSTTGDAEPTYSLSADGQVVTIRQTMSVTMTGDGPWQAAVQVFTDGATGSVTNLTLRSELTG